MGPEHCCLLLSWQSSEDLSRHLTWQAGGCHSHVRLWLRLVFVQYVLPCRQTLLRQMILDLHSDLTARVHLTASVQSQITAATSHAITTDMWTSINQHAFMRVTAHWLSINQHAAMRVTAHWLTQHFTPHNWYVDVHKPACLHESDSPLLSLSYLKWSM